MELVFQLLSEQPASVSGALEISKILSITTRGCALRALAHARALKVAITPY